MNKSVIHTRTTNIKPVNVILLIINCSLISACFPRRIFKICKLECGLDQNPTVVIGERQQKQLGRNRGIPNPSWTLVETNIIC